MKTVLLPLILGALLSTPIAVAKDKGDALKTATQIARNALAKELHMNAATLELLSSEAQTWPDSSLGCGKPGSTASQVITSGYELIFRTTEGNYRVHTADKYAIVCGPATLWRSSRGNVPLRNLNPMIDRARDDLAKRFGVSMSEIRTLNFAAATWPDTSMNCAIVGEPIQKQTVKGYRIALGYRDRIYTYHTDLSRVRACPPIENE